MLSNFSIDGKRERIWVYDKVAGRTYASSVKDAGAENNFNTVTIQGTRINFEGKFQAADDLLASLTTKIVKAESLACLSTTERNETAYLASLQLLRVGIQRSTLLSMAQSLKRLLGPDASEELNRKLDSFDENAARQIALSRLQDAAKHAPAFLAKDWVLHRAPAAYPFWTSDNPIVMMNVFPYGNVGLSAAGVQIAWPLSATLALEFMCPSIAARLETSQPELARLLRGSQTLDCTPDNVTFHNSQQVLQSARFVYGPTGDFALADRILRDNPDAANRTSSMQVGEMGVLPKKEGMPAGQWLVVYGRLTHYMLPIEAWADADGGVDVEISRTGAQALVTMLADSPFSSIEIYNERSPWRGMRDITISLVEGSLFKLRIRHADKSIADLFRGLDR
jgi:Protein of unknown function (DUF4238)